MAKKPAIVAMTNGSSAILTDPEEIVAYHVVRLFKNPGFTTSVNRGDELSFKSIAAGYMGDPEGLCAEIETRLRTVLSKYLENEVLISCEYTATDDTEDAYKLDLSITSVTGTPLLAEGPINVIDGEPELGFM